MICPKCEAERIYVQETRQSPKETIRCRVCKKCGHIIYTSEKIIDPVKGNNLIRRYERGEWEE